MPRVEDAACVPPLTDSTLAKVKHMIRLILAAVLLATPAFAARMEVATLQDPPRRWLRISQSILPGDERTFRDLIASAPGATVVLSGPGGSVAAALAIGREIQDRRLGTLVPASTDCASACSLIWLTGQRRLLGRGARIGFHALSVRSGDGTRTQTHEFDPVLRRYLNQLGLAADMTATIVNTNATGMRWMDPIELRANGVAIEAYP